jgi:hypothetical protein
MTMKIYQTIDWTGISKSRIRRNEEKGEIRVTLTRTESRRFSLANIKTDGTTRVEGFGAFVEYTVYRYIVGSGEGTVWLRIV